MKERLSCSIVINTLNREPYVRRLLASLQHLTYEPLEVVVVNGPSTDSTPALLEAYKGKVKAIECPVANLSVSRNMGIAASSGDIVVFIDDDALPASHDWLERLLEPFQADTGAAVAASGGRVLFRDSDEYEFEDGMTSDYAMQVFTAAQLQQATLSERWVRGVRGCNCAFRRDALIEIGGFDEYYSYYLEESDVCRRLAARGYEIAHQPGAVARHYMAGSSRRTTIYEQSWREITRSDTYFCMKNGRDAVPMRLIKTILKSPQKHYFDLMRYGRRDRRISTRIWLKFLAQWCAGVWAGVLGGLFAKRRTRERPTGKTPFLEFPRPLPKRKLRICLLSQLIPPSAETGGVGRYIYALGQGLHQLGHEVHLITRAEERVRYEGLDFVVHGVTSAQFSKIRMFPGFTVLNKNTAYSVAVVHRLLDLYESGITFDVVHAPNWDIEGLATIKSRIYATILTLVSPLVEVMEAEGWSPSEDLRACVALDRWQIEQADVVCVPSAGVIPTYETKMGIDIEKLDCIRIVPLGIVPENHATPPASLVDGKRLLFVGRLERRKGIDVLLEALPDVLQAYPEWECDIVGDDTLVDRNGRTPKEQFLARHRGSDWLKRVRFHGRVSNEALHEFYRNCTIFVAPSRFESFGLIYLEAMQYGRPVIGCHAGGISEVVQSEVDGILVEPGDSHVVKAAIVRLIEDPTLRERLGRNAAEKVQNNGHYLRMATEMVEVYEEVMRRVGKVRRRRLEEFEIETVPLTDQLRSGNGKWSTREESSSGDQCLFTNVPGADLSFDGRASSVLNLVFMRHEWSGVIQISVDGGQLLHLDLFSAHTHYANYQVPAIAKTRGRLKIILRVHAERNPRSKGHEVWIKRAYFTKAQAKLANSEPELESETVNRGSA